MRGISVLLGRRGCQILDDYPKATTHLEAFLRTYQTQDAWTARAKEALTRMEQDIPADESFSVHH